MPELTIRPFAVDEVDLVEPLWCALLDHHQAVAPDLGTFRDPGASWLRRRGIYVDWFADSGTFGLVAQAGAGTAIGYAMVRVQDGPATLDLRRVAEVETLAVLPAARGAGIGARLMAAVREEVRSRGAEQLALHVVNGNDAAMRFYARHGLRPTVTVMAGSV